MEGRLESGKEGQAQVVDPSALLDSTRSTRFPGQPSHHSSVYSNQAFLGSKERLKKCEFVPTVCLKKAVGIWYRCREFWGLI